MNPQDGAAIGDMNSVVVTINRNDDVNGAFSFDSVLVSHNTQTDFHIHIYHRPCTPLLSVDGELDIYQLLLSWHLCFPQILLPESESPDDPNGVATLTVLRSSSTVGEVTVYWRVSQDGLMDLQPTSGNLTFRDVSNIYTHCLTSVLTLVMMKNGVA